MKLRLLLGTALIAACTGGAVVAYLGAHPSPTCEAALDDRSFGTAAEACSREFEDTHDGELAAAAAMAWLGAGQPDKAWTWANLPESKDRIRARRVRGVVLKMRGDADGARRELEQALSEALAASRADEAARAAHALAGLQWEQGQYSAAWASLEISAQQAKEAHDGPALALAELARGDVLRDLGDARRADAYFRKALEDSEPWPTDHIYALLKVGLSERDRGAYALARKHFEKALGLAESIGNARLVVGLKTNLADNLVRSEDAAGAERWLRELPESAFNAWEAQLVRARIALLQHDAAAALKSLESIEREELSSEDEWGVDQLRGDAAMMSGNRAAAEAAWAKAIDEVEELSLSEPEYQGWVVARRRAPYDELFASLAARGEAARAWEVVSRFILSESLSLTGAAGADIPTALASAEALKAGWSRTVIPPAIEGHAPDLREVIVLHEAAGRFWIGRRVDDEAHWLDAGPLERIEPLLHRFLGDPGDTAAAEELGSTIWKTAGLQRSDSPLYVAATGRLRGLALAALRVDGRYWFQLRPLARLPTLAPPSSDAVSFAGDPVVVGDPKGDLVSARNEIKWIARRFGARPLLGAAATREALLNTHQSSLLHLATHSEIGLDGTRLVLADGEVSAQEILRDGPCAKVVVLASCASAAGRDAAGSDSLTTAFLRAGSGAVLGTLRTVPDAAAQQLVRAFYEEGGANDPVRALARAQARVEAYQPAPVWSAFVISVGDRLK